LCDEPLHAANISKDDTSPKTVTTRRFLLTADTDSTEKSAGRVAAPHSSIPSMIVPFQLEIETAEILERDGANRHSQVSTASQA
jgi:hypothetical protein